MVLQVLRLYLRATTPPIEIPGREAHPGDRAKGQASALIPSGLRSAVMRMPTKPVATYDTPKMHYNTGAPPPHDAKAILRLFQVRLADANAVASTAPHAEGASEGVGTPTDGITVEARAIDGEPDTRCVQIHGPHDVLRWLADDVEALWT